MLGRYPWLPDPSGDCYVLRGMRQKIAFGELTPHQRRFQVQAECLSRRGAGQRTRDGLNVERAQVFLFAAVPSPGGAPASAPTPHPDLGDIQANLPRLSSVEKVS
jgi:hypothetical protein